jgi:hypothetical protein
VYILSVDSFSFLSINIRLKNEQRNKLMLPGSALKVSLLGWVDDSTSYQFRIQFTTLIPYPGIGFLEEYILLGDIVNLKI